MSRGRHTPFPPAPALPPTTARRRAVRPAALAAVVLGAGALAACGTPVDLEPAPSAAAPECGQVLQATPDALFDRERRSTSSQASTAWGTPPITLRCGVTPPPPTTAECLSIELPDGTVHDWIHEDAAEVPTDGNVSAVDSTWVTYGRVPAIEVHIPAEMFADASAILIDLGDTVETTEQVASCVGADDVAEAESAAAEAASDGESPSGR